MPFWFQLDAADHSPWGLGHPDGWDSGSIRPWDVGKTGQGHCDVSVLASCEVDSWDILHLCMSQKGWAAWGSPGVWWRTYSLWREESRLSEESASPLWKCCVFHADSTRPACPRTQWATSCRGWQWLIWMPLTHRHGVPPTALWEVTTGTILPSLLTPRATRVSWQPRRWVGLGFAQGPHLGQGGLQSPGLGVLPAWDTYLGPFTRECTRPVAYSTLPSLLCGGIPLFKSSPGTQFIKQMHKTESLI